MHQNIEDIYPLSPMQKGMLFHSILNAESAEYFEQISIKLEGQLDTAAFEKAWQELVNRHAIFRTAFVWEDVEEPLQVVHNHLEIKFETADLSCLNANEQTKKIEAYCKQKRTEGFDLSDAPLMRFALFKLNGNTQKFIWNHHHLLFDGWGLPLILKEVFLFYEAFRQGQPIDLPKGRPYRDYIAWLQKQDQSAAEAFWKMQLKGFSAPTPFNIDRIPRRQTIDSEPYRKEEFKFSAEVTEKLQDIARTNKLTLNTILQGAWALLLHKYSREDDVIFGATVSGRPAELPGSDEMIGLFINTLPVRTFYDPQKPMLDWLQDIQQQQVSMREFEYTPLFDIQKWSDVPANVPLFESILVFENYPVEESVKEQKSSLRMSGFEFFSKTNFPITLAAGPGKRLSLIIAYDALRFAPEVIQRLHTHLDAILTAFTQQPDIHLAHINIVDAAEYELLVDKLNQTHRDFKPDQCIHEWFEHTVSEHPDKNALFHNNHTLTYGELNAKANQLARYLRESGVGAETLVAILLERSPEMVIALLAVLKAGGAYVPMDPDYPLDRLNYMFANSGAEFVISTSGLLDGKSYNSAKPALLDQIGIAIQVQSKTNLKNTISPENLAYVIYTSGSTGRPKGVLMQHRGVINLIHAMIEDYGISDESRVLQFASFSFDAAVAETFLGLLPGAELYLANRETVLSADALRDFMIENQISALTFPPSLLSTISDFEFPDLKTVVSVGEACSWDLAERWKNKAAFFNGYGPTETTVGCTWGLVGERIPETSTAPIGHPIANDRIYILDSFHQPVPVGIPGEIHIGSPGIARGYLGRPDLTADKFIPDPFSREPDARLYRSGDLARFLPDGLIEYLGRIDQQVKIRGFRIELGEIESALLNLDGVRDAVVLARDDNTGNKQLAAYIIPENMEQIDTITLKDSLKEVLPEFMIPNRFIAMENFPVTPNGKIDRNALPAPESAETEDHVEPRNAQEEIIAGIFADILHLPEVGIHNSFFALGGHSLLATQVVSRIRDAFDIEMPLRVLFESTTVAQLSDQITLLKKQDDAFIKPIPLISRDGELSLSFAQQRLWFLDQLEPGSASYNLPVAIRLEGNLNITALENSFTEIIQRHETLRTTFASEQGKPKLAISSAPDFRLKQFDLSPLPSDQKEAEALKLAEKDSIEPFDLARGPLFRSTLIRLSDADFILLINMHHIISDGWSSGILIREVSAFYRAFVEQTEPALAALELQYADFAAWQRNRLQGAELERQISYWKTKLAGSPPLLEIPTDRPRPAVQTFNGAAKHREISGTTTEELIEFSRREGVTVFMSLLAAFQVLLHRYSNQDEILVGSPIANRTRSEIESLIGFFVNTLVFKAEIGDNPSFTELARQVRETALGAYAHQDLPFEKLVEELQPVRDLSHAPIFQVAFVYQNMPSSGGTELPDLRMIPFETENVTAKYDLTLNVARGANGFLCSLEYNSDLFDAETADRLLQHYSMLLDQILTDPEKGVDDLAILTEKERAYLLNELNQTVAEFPSGKCVHQWFEEIAHNQPDAPAVVFMADRQSEPVEFNYRQLNERANQLARYLRSMHIGPEKIVGICMERSADMITGMLAILKAGGAYVPIDPAYPQERIQYMIEDSGLDLILTQQVLHDRLPSRKASVFCIDSDWEKIQVLEKSNLQNLTDPENMAYLIYTSGSTGRPKGTMLRHRGACNLAKAQINAFHVGPGSRIMQFSSLSFDAATWEFVMALLSGSALILSSSASVANGQELVIIMAKQEVTAITIPPSVLSVLPQEPLPELKTIITAGEAVSGELVEQWGKNRQFVNAYGPTETTVCASMHECAGTYPQGPPIGKPIGNFQLYILDRQLQPVPMGVPGELCMAGIGLARGYLGRPDLTAEKFIPNPFSEEPGSRLYRSGDLVRYLPDGNIEFLSRIDQQVKVRGFRIELGEIEAVLDKHEWIADCAVLAREDTPGDKRLAAYVVPKDGQTIRTAELKDHLRNHLPEYMVPLFILALDKLPLTPNGKLDRKALPAPEISRSELSGEYVAPRSESEEKLVQIVGELLKVEKVGIHDNFFELGGHSLLATQFMSRIREEFNLELPLKILFEKPTCAGIAESIQVRQDKPEVEETSAPVIQRVSREARKVRRPK